MFHQQYTYRNWIHNASVMFRALGRNLWTMLHKITFTYLSVTFLIASPVFSNLVTSSLVDNFNWTVFSKCCFKNLVFGMFWMIQEKCIAFYTGFSQIAHGCFSNSWLLLRNIFLKEYIWMVPCEYGWCFQFQK